VAQTISNPPTQAQVQAIQNKLNETDQRRFTARGVKRAERRCEERK